MYIKLTARYVRKKHAPLQLTSLLSCSLPPKPGQHLNILLLSHNPKRHQSLKIMKMPHLVELLYKLLVFTGPMYVSPQLPQRRVQFPARSERTTRTHAPHAASLRRWRPWWPGSRRAPVTWQPSSHRAPPILWHPSPRPHHPNLGCVVSHWGADKGTSGEQLKKRAPVQTNMTYIVQSIQFNCSYQTLFDVSHPTQSIPS